MEARITHWSAVDFIKGEVKVAMLSQNASSKEIQITMGAGSKMKEHKAPAPISVQVLLGEIDFEVCGETHKLKALDMISLEANIAHSLNAIKDSIIRLSLSQNDSVKRVSAVSTRHI